MAVILAALDKSSAALPVLKNAQRLGELTASETEAVYISGAGGIPETLELLATRAHVPLHSLAGEVVDTLLDAASAPPVLALAIGARATPGGRRPVGRIAQGILERARKPIVVVPPDAPQEGTIQRLLLPLEGTEASSRPVLQALCPLLVRDVELLVLHVFTDATLPRMLDRPHYDLELIGREFLAIHCPPATHIELRPGPVAARVAEVADERRSDLVVLSWAQDSSPGRANVVREVLGTSSLPVLLLPLAPRS